MNIDHALVVIKRLGIFTQRSLLSDPLVPKLNTCNGRPLITGFQLLFFETVIYQLLFYRFDRDLMKKITKVLTF